jgi:hypothetical protein
MAIGTRRQPPEVTVRQQCKVSNCTELAEFSVALNYGWVGLVDLYQLSEVLDPEAGEGGRADVVDSVDGQASRFRVHRKSDMP